MNFTPLDNKGTVEGFFIIKSVDKKTSSKGDAYLDIMLADSSGEINAKLWNYSEAAYGEYAANELVKVRGTVSVYSGKDQLRIDRIRTTNAADNVRPEDFVKTADYSGDAMYEELVRTASSFEDGDLKKLVLYMLEQNRTALLYWPAAFKLHHAVRGGLLMHTLSIVRLCQAVSKIYLFVDSDLLIAGAILHDIAKLTEFEVGDTGIASGYTVKGNLIGHLAEGAMMVRKASEQLGIPQEKSMLIEHMLLSHHGEPEYGAAVRPMFIEAELLSELDMLDARMYEMHEAVEGTAANDFTGKLWALDNRKLYNHGRSEIENKTKLM